MSNSETYIHQIMRSVPGWFYDQDVACFLAINEMQRAGGTSGALVEVGVYCGKSLGLIATFRGRDEAAYAFDLYKTEGSLERAQDTVRRAAGNLEGVHFITANSLEISPQYLRGLVPQSVRFLHVDAGHEYHEALSDLRTFAGVTGSDAVIAIDDYYDRDFPGVSLATSEFIGESDFVPFLAGWMKLYLCRASYVDRYVRAALALTLFQQNARLVRFKGRSPMVVAFSPKPFAHLENLARLEAVLRGP
jgi:hypothetical protein